MLQCVELRVGLRMENDVVAWRAIGWSAVCGAWAREQHVTRLVQPHCTSVSPCRLVYTLLSWL